MMSIVNGVMTLVLIILFLGIWAWAWSGKNKSKFDQMARLPLEEGQVTQHDKEGDQHV